MTVEPPDDALQFDGTGQHRPDIRTITWHSKQSKDEWGDYIMRTHGVAPREIEWMEFIDESSPRDVVIFNLTHKNRTEWLQKVAESGETLHYNPIRDVEPYTGLAEKHVEASSDDPQRMTYGVIGKDESAVEEVHESEIRQPRKDHEIIGQHLGFPDCCTRHHQKISHPNNSSEKYYRIASNSPSAQPINDDPHEIHVTDAERIISPYWKEFNVSTVTHIPHSLECEESVEVAERRLEYMDELGHGEYAEKTLEWLNEPHIFHAKNGMYTVTNKHATLVSSRTPRQGERLVVVGDIEEVRDELGAF